MSEQALNSPAVAAAAAITLAGSVSTTTGSTLAQSTTGTTAGVTNIPVPIVTSPTPTTVPATLAVSQPQQVVVTQQLSAVAPGTSQVSMTPALTQIVASQPITTQVQAPTAGAVIRSSIPGTVQVIQGHPFVQQQYMQQQYYVHSVQAMQAQPIGQQMNLTAVQGRPGSSGGQKSPIISGAQVGSQTVTLKSMAPSMTTVSGTQTKPKTVLQQQQAMFGAKQVLRGATGQPLVIGQLGVLQNAGGTQTIVAQPKSPAVTLTQGGGTQVINSPTQIRFTTQPTFVNSQGQIISGTVSPAMLNQLQMAPIQQNALPLGTQLLGSQSAVIGTQPLYLRPAGSIQTPQGIMGSVQAMIPTNKPIKQGTDASGTVQMKSTGTQVKTVATTQVRGVANILPQTARPFGQLPGSPTMAKGVQTGQFKQVQVSRVRALRPTKTTLAAVTATGHPARIAPQAQIGARLFTPTMTRPPTLLVQPKPQVAQQQRTMVTTPSTQVVTLAPIPVATITNTQTQTAVAKPVIATESSTVAISPLRTHIPIVSPMKVESSTQAESSASSPDIEPMEIEPPPPVLVEARPLPVTGTALPQTGTGPPKLISTGPPKTGGGGMVGAGAGPGPDRSKTDRTSIERSNIDRFSIDRSSNIDRFNTDRVSNTDRFNIDRFNSDRSSNIDRFNSDRSNNNDRFNTDRTNVDIFSNDRSNSERSNMITMDRPNMDRPNMDRPNIERSNMDRPNIERSNIERSNMDNGPPSLGPPIPTLHRERNVRVATVIGERQAAIVKPNILTHVIEGFVIQEGTEPFPVQRCSTLSDFIPGRSSSQEVDSGVEKDTDDIDSSASSTDSKPKTHTDIPKLKCEYCGTMASARRFGNSRRFCSRPCAKRYNVGCTRRLGFFQSRKRNKVPGSVTSVRKHKNLQMKRVWKRGQTGRVTTGPIQRNPEASPLTVDNIRAHTNTTHQEGTDCEADLDIGISGLGAPSSMSIETTTTTSDESERSTTPSGHDESSSPRSPPELERVEMDMDMCNPGRIPLRHPSKWTVRDVVDFIDNLAGCSIYADEFNRQEIDGQALMLLKEDHLMSTMNVKLGPALKICAKVKSLVEELP